MSRLSDAVAGLSEIVSRLRGSRAARNAAASYFAFFSFGLCSFVSIPAAVHYLRKEQIGLWTLIALFLEYLVWLDLGVGAAIGRKVADAIAAEDGAEMDRWWSAANFVLMVQGVLLLIVGWALIPVCMAWFKVPEGMRSEAAWLLAGCVLLAGLNLPLRAYPGVLTAQERFHWVPLVQGLVPWVQVAVFVICLRAGYGMFAYLIGTVVSQLGARMVFGWLLRLGPHRFRITREGWQMGRFKALFGFSLNLTAVGLVDSVIASLPGMILARTGGLAMVPVYSFTARGGDVVAGVVRRTTHAFYPRLQRLQVDGARDEFAAKFKSVCLLTLFIGLAAGGVVLAGNRMLVEVLAGADYFGGPMATAWFAVGVIITPLSGTLQGLLHYSGSMSRSWLVALLRLGVGIGLAVWLVRVAGIAGLAATFALLPMLQGAYGYFRGAKNCGFRPAELGGAALKAGAVITAVILAAGLLLTWYPTAGPVLPFHQRFFHLPGWLEMLAGGLLFVTGGVMALRQAVRVQRT